MGKKSIEEKVKELIKEEKFFEIKKTLTDEILKNENSENLYIYRGQI